MDCAPEAAVLVILAVHKRYTTGIRARSMGLVTAS